jgi:hypothetical protein
MKTTNVIFLCCQVFGRIREIFEVFDLNGDKALDVVELRHAFICMVSFVDVPCPYDLASIYYCV